MRMAERILRLVVAALLCALPLAGFTQTDAGSAIDGPGPALSIDQADFQRRFRCLPTDAETPRPGAVLLVHGTALTAKESWPKTYGKSLRPLGYNLCSINLPNRSLDDIQVSAEYVVAALRRMHHDFGARIDAIGHSQGGLEIRWAIRWWPDIRTFVDDVIDLATPNHGTPTADALCLQQLAGCSESIQQQRPAARFLAALNRGDETPGDAVSYTSIFSLTDEIVTTLPPDFSPALDGAANVLIQDVCPGRVVLHIPELIDAAVFHVVVDALSHDGPADTGRLGPAVCNGLFAPRVEPDDALATSATYLPALLAVGTSPGASEPPVADYARR